jgi:alpha-tubulin suppressor-like RCC1 family protein
MEVLQNTLDLDLPNPAIPWRVSLYTWGKNTNYVLGHGDQDDRAHPCRVKSLTLSKIPFDMNYYDNRQFQILDVSLAKLHTAIVVDADRDNLLVCGYGSNGRLGTGSEETAFTLQPVLGINEKVAKVSCAKDHTIVVTEQGHVWAFGSNQYGQLGFNNSEGKFKYFSPQQILVSHKREQFIGCTTSSWHSVVFTARNVYTFGRSLGQLGYLCDGESQFLPRKISPWSEVKIAQAAATVRCIFAKT